MDGAVAKLERGIARGKVHSIIVVAEGAAKGFEVAEEIERRMGTEIRLQSWACPEGGTPTAFDRLLCLEDGRQGRGCPCFRAFKRDGGGFGNTAQTCAADEVLGVEKPDRPGSVQVGGRPGQVN